MKDENGRERHWYTARRMMDHHVCPKTRRDSARMKNVARGREESNRREKQLSLFLSQRYRQSKSGLIKQNQRAISIYFVSFLRELDSALLIDGSSLARAETRGVSSPSLISTSSRLKARIFACDVARNSRVWRMHEKRSRIRGKKKACGVGSRGRPTTNIERIIREQQQQQQR